MADNKDKLVRSRVSALALGKYEQARKKAEKRVGYPVSFSEWVRQALERQADSDLLPF